MGNILKLYKEPSDFGPTSKPGPFPGEGDNWAYIADYKYSATRMSSAPNITATLKWPRCLDNEWSTNVFVSYNGERFFIKNTPSSSYDNTSCLYSHSLELVSERAILDSVYFLNVPTTTSDEGDNSQGDSLSNSTEVTFPGDIHEFVDRLNKSLWKSDIGYSAVVDKDVTSDTKLFTISNQYVTDVLKSAYELYEVPYYFVGKEIHFGNQQNIISTPPLEYGVDNSLLSISKSNSNKQVVTRITGTGSDRNIPYYYPNPTPKGHLKLGGSSSDKYIITDEATFGDKVELKKPFGFFCGICDMLSTGPLTPVFEKYQNGTAIELAKCSEYTLYRIQIKFIADNAGTSSTNLVPIRLDPRGNVLDYVISDYFIAGTLTYGKGNEQDVIVDNGILKTPEAVYYYGGIEFTLTITILTPIVGENDSAIIYINPSANNWVNDTDIEAVTEIANKFSLPISMAVSRVRPGYIFIKNLFSHLGKPGVTINKYFVRGDVLYDGSSIGLISMNEDGEIDCGFLQSGEYIVECIYKLPWPITPDTVAITTQQIFEKKLLYSDGSALPTLDKIGLSLAEGCETSLGDELTQLVDYRVDVQKALMPSEYRRTDGGNMWYNATNSTDRGKWYGNIVFDNVYDKRHPVEYIHTDEEIYPTIKGVKNADGKNIDTFLDIAFDQYDNNERYPEDYEDEKLAGKYKHPYFFAKLKKTDGANGFNLFDHAIEGETMKISFTTGHVAGCEFEVGVDEETHKNPVQVDTNGDLVRDNDRNVVVRGDYIESQQDTRNNEVWIALKKEDSTMGVLMPDTSSGLVPLGDLGPEGDIRENGGDTFVILGIHLPEAYITAAEDRLEQELIKYLKENNSERFSFSLKLSSIYLAENSMLANTLNENSRVTLIYNDVPYTMYVTSYSLTVKESSALPEVTISINDELKVVKPKIKDVSQLIKATDVKLKTIADSSNSLRAKVLSTEAQNKDVSERLVVVENNIGDVNIEKLNTDSNAHSLMLTQLANKLSSLALATENLNSMVSAMDNRMTVLVITPDEN